MRGVGCSMAISESLLGGGGRSAGSVPWCWHFSCQRRAAPSWRVVISVCSSFVTAACTVSESEVGRVARRGVS